MEAPVILKPVPSQVVNERAAYGPFDLKEFIGTSDLRSPLQFSAELTDGRCLPQGMICTADGILTGIPAKDTHDMYDVVVTASNEAGSVTATFSLTIKPSLLSAGTSEFIDTLKSQVWSALGKNLPMPELAELLEQAVTPLDIYYLLERWGTLTIYDAFNLEMPGNKVALTLKGASEHYHVYDRGCCLIATPKDLFSHVRTLEDGLRTARAMANEVYQRKWTIELIGFEKLTRAAWVEIQHLNHRQGKELEIINYHPGTNDLRIYQAQAIERSAGISPE